MRVLVTGASGRLGRSLQRRLVRSPTYTPSFLVSPRTKVYNANEHSVDITNDEALRLTFDELQPDMIVHLAAIAGESCVRDPSAAWAVNVEAVRRLIELAEEFATNRIVFASTTAVYGDQGNTPYPETGPVAPSSLYANTKWQAEQLLRASSSLETASLRIANIFGDEFDSSLVWRLVHSSSTEPVALRGPHDFIRDYIHVDDVVDAILSTLTVTLSTRHETVNIGSGIPTSNAELIETLAERHSIHYKLQSGPRSYSCMAVAHAAQLLEFHAARRP